MKTYPRHNRRFGKVRAVWCILRGGTVIMNVNLEVTGMIHSIGDTRWVQYNNVLVNGRKLKLTDLVSGK